MMSKQSEHKAKSWEHFISGLLGSFFGVTICHPLEVARTRLNLQHSTISQNKYNGLFDALKKILTEEGVKGYYKGYRVTIVSVPLFYSLFFSIYEKNKIFVQENLQLTGFKNNLISSILTGAICDFVTNPLWMVRTRMQIQYLHDQNNIQYTGLIQAIKTIIKNEGFFSIYKGLGVSLFGLSHVAVQFPTYEKFKELLQDQKQVTHLGNFDILKASVLSKLIACLITYPHVVLRTRLHDNRQNYQFAAATNKLSLRQIILDIYQKNGLRGFYFGLRADLIRVLPMNAITFVVYEKTSFYLKEKY